MDKPESYTAGEAAKILELTRRRVSQLAADGTLEGWHEEPGNVWKISKRSVHALRDSRPPRERRRGDPESALEARERAAVLQSRVEDLLREIGQLEGRKEIEEIARSTLAAQLLRERERADRLEGELSRIRRPWWSKLWGS
jgi:hypothetical protein